MTRVFKAMAVLLALLWVPLISHCDLEHLPGMEWIACCDSAQAEPHQNDDCASDVCASVESGHYKTEEQPVSAPQPCLFPTLLSQALSLHSADLPPASACPVAVREELPRRWAFTLRLALSPRAPSALA